MAYYPGYGVATNQEEEEEEKEMDWATILAMLQQLSKWLGDIGDWFSETKWTPTNIDPAMKNFKKLLDEGAITQEEYNELKSRRDEAYSYYKKHHAAWPWDKPHYLKMFQNAVNSFWNYADPIIKRVSEEVPPGTEVTGWPSWLKWTVPIGVVGTIILTGIAIWKEKKSKGG